MHKKTKRKIFRRKYSPKQIAHYLSITKDIKKLKVWTKRQQTIKTKVIKDITKLEQQISKLKTENAKLKADKRKEQAIKWAIKQGIQIEKKIDNKYGERNLQAEAERKTKQILKTVTTKKDLIDYLKENKISQIRRNYKTFTTNPKEIYSALLDEAMQNPNEFKEEIINQIDKLKNLIEIELTIYGEYKGQTIESAKLTTRGKTIEITDLEELIREILKIKDKNPKEILEEIGLEKGQLINEELRE